MKYLASCQTVFSCAANQNTLDWNEPIKKSALFKTYKLVAIAAAAVNQP